MVAMRLIAANWKMNKTISETEEYIKNFIPLVKDVNDREILLCPPFTSLQVAGELLKDTNIKLGAQNCFYEKKGAFTGEISLDMIKETRASYVIVGHSERRHIFGENDELINKKVTAVLEAGLRPILCVGEKLEERNSGITFKVVETQLKIGLSGIEEYIDRIDIAYEPVWAIGTGVPATPEDAKEVHSFIRETLRRLNPDAKGNSRILYGGSVKPENASEFMKYEEINGLLVGTASLDPDSFSKIVKSF